MGALKKRCKTVGCPNLHTNTCGYCDECIKKYRASHPEAHREEARQSSYQRGYDYKWRQFAKQYLKEHPRCAICGAPAKVVDHKVMPADVMLKEYGFFILDPSYYQPLCYSCNNRKGAHEDVAFRNRYEDDKAWLAAHAELTVDAVDGTPDGEAPEGGV